jgi:hypothetical protein
MSSNAIPSETNLMKARIKLPQHVVYRTFPAETVVLNLETGKYHGLNPTAGRMLEILERAGTVLEAASAVAEDYEQPQAATERDMCELCGALLTRGLIEVEEDDGAG